jgi:hypothetical protein
MKPESTNSVNGFVKKNYEFLLCRPRYEGMVKITNQATVSLREAVRLRRGEGNCSCGTIFQPQKSLEKCKKGRALSPSKDIHTEPFYHAEISFHTGIFLQLYKAASISSAPLHPRIFFCFITSYNNPVRESL